MISSIQKGIIIRALEIRRKSGEDPETVLEGYRNLAGEEKQEILETLGTGQPAGK